jgi:hypothetical protein
VKTEFSPRTLQEVESTLVSEENRVRREAMQLLADGQLTPEMALAKWMEIAAFDRVRKRLDRGTPKRRS